MSGQWIISAVLVVPALGALAAVLLPARAGRLAGTVAAAVTLVAATVLVAYHGGHGLWSVNPGGGGQGGAAIQPWTSVDLSWVPGFNLRFHLGVDGVSYPLVVLTALLTLLCCGYTMWKPPHGARLLISLLLAVEVGILGVFLALDLILFFVFFEIVLLPMYAVIAGWGGEHRRRAARKFVLYTLFGSVLLLVGILLVVANAGTADLVKLTGGEAGAAGLLGRGTQLAAFAFLAIAFAVKSPLWPLHTWLPDAHTEAPTVGSVLLAGVLLKMGTYGFVRVALPELPQGARDAAPALGVLAVVAVVYGSLCCLAQTDLKRLIAYSSVGHMGFVLLGIATLSSVGIDAALYGNIAHGVVTGLLFFLVGGVKDRYGTASIQDIGGGLMARAPYLASLLTVAAIASLGLPGLAGFWGELFALLGAYDPGGGLSPALFRGLLAVGLVGTLLTAGYFLWMLQRVTLGVVPARWRAARTRDVGAVELLAWAPLVVLTVVLGLYPRLVFGVTH